MATAAALVLCGVMLEANALALGAINVRSALGEPLRAEIEVPDISSQEAATFTASVAAPEAFRAAGVEYTTALANARVSLHRRANGQAYLRVTGDRPVNEPFLGIVIETTSSSGRLVRDYTMLLDPPGHTAPPPVLVTPTQITPPPVATPAPAPMTAALAPVVVAPPSETPAPVVRSAASVRRAATTASALARRAPVEAPTGEGAQVKIQRGDTASGIAAAHIPDGVSLDQMLVAMLRANPSAFIGGNVNRMKAGVVLNIPSAEQAAATPRQAARQQVAAQTRDFNAYRRGLAQRSAATRTAAASRSASGGVQPQVRESRAAASLQDRLTLSRGGAPSDTESKVARARHAQEQKARVAELNKNINDLAKLQAASGKAPPASSTVPGIAVPVGAAANSPATPAAPSAVAAPKIAGISASSATPATRSASASSAPSAAPAALVAASNAVTLAASAASAAADGSAPPTSNAASAAQAAVSTASVAAAAAPDKPRFVPAAAPIEEPSFLDSLTENPMLPVAGAAILALLVGYGFYRSRQRTKQTSRTDSSFVGSRQSDSFFGASGGERVNTKHGGSAVSGNSSMSYSPSQLDAAADVDPVAEADVYLAYGRDMQAEEILREALRTQPGRATIHRKLAEIYAKRRDARALEAIAVEAYHVTKGSGTDWLMIASLGSELEPTNPLYQPGGTPVRVSSSAPSRHTFGADTVPQSMHGLDDVPPHAKANAPLDFDLDVPAHVRTASPVGPQVAHRAAMGAPVTSVADTAVGTTRIATPPVAVAVAPTALSSHAVSPNLDLAGDFGSPPKLGKLQAPVDTLRPSSSLSAGVSTESGFQGFELHSLSSEADARSSGNSHTQQPDADEDPVGTKLALAREFHAVGDVEGARALLKEVIAESSGVMRTKAERFLSELT